MPDLAPEAAAALAVVRDFMRLSVDVNDIDAAKALLTKKSTEAGQFNPSDMKGSTYVIAEPTTEGEGKIERVIVPVTVTPPAGAPQPQMTVPITLVIEDGNWRIDLIATIDRLFGGSMENVLSELGNAMGKAMEGIGNAIGDAMKDAFGGLSAEPKITTEQIETIKKDYLDPGLESLQRAGINVTVDIDYASLFPSDDQERNRQGVYHLGDAWRALEYALRNANEKFPLEDRIKVIRLEGPRDTNPRLVYADAGKLVYRCDPTADDGYYYPQTLESILLGVIAGTPERLDPREDPQPGPVQWLYDDGATLAEKYHVQVLPKLAIRLGELVGEDVAVYIDWDQVGADADLARGLFFWGAVRVVGALAQLCANAETRELLRGGISQVSFNFVSSSDQRSAKLVDGDLQLSLSLATGESGNYYEFEIAETISAGLMLKERPAAEDIRREAAVWAERFQERFNRPLPFQLDFAGFCSGADTNQNLFALTLLREHGVDHAFYAISGLYEKNPNFDQQCRQRVEAVRLVSVSSPADKYVRADGNVIVIGLYLFEGYNGYFTIKDLEKQIATVVAGMPELSAEPAPEQVEESGEAPEEAAEEESPDDAEAERAAKQFADLRTHIEQTLPVYAQNMLAIVGKAIAIDLDWDSLNDKSENIGNLLNLGLTPVLGGIAYAVQDPAIRAAITERIDRILLRNVADATEQGFTLNGRRLVYSLMLLPNIPPLDPQLASTLIKAQLTAPPPTPKPTPKKSTPSKPAKKPAPKKPTPKRPKK